MEDSESGLQEQILETAKKLFVAKGYHGMSMREISDALGVSKAALYYYFKDKEELFLAILTIYLDQTSGALDRILAEPVPGTQKIRKFVEYVLTQPPEQRATIRLASQEITQLQAETRKAFGAIYREKFMDKVGAILQEGMKKGEFRKVRGDVAVRALLGIMFPYLDPTHSGEATVPAETIDEIVKIYLGGIRS